VSGDGAGIRPGIIVHGGAGAKTRDGEKLDGYRRGLAAAARCGMEVLRLGGTPLDAVEQAVRAMEDAGDFNAGRGSSLDLEGDISCDAAVMRGADLAAGGCGAVRGVLHPVSLARRVMEQTDHVLMVAEGAELLAKHAGLAPLVGPPSEDQRRQHAELLKIRESLPGGGDRLERLRDMLRHGGEADTVGAVAVDAQGRLATAVSTGGLWLKLPGRVGDSAMIGAGLACDDDAGGVVATGIGEAIARLSLSRAATEAMRAGATAQEACRWAVRYAASKLGVGTAGLIAIDARGRPGAALNTPFMGRAWLRQGMAEPWVGLDAEDGPPPLD
jgi:beta-aspartyl-peptidase (threonine type)